MLAPLLLLAAASPVQAHEIRPAYLQIEERAPGRYDLLWKAPTRDGPVSAIRPAFTLIPMPGERVVDGFALFRHALDGDAPPRGTSLRIEGLESAALEALVNRSLLDDARHGVLLEPSAPAVEFQRAPSPFQAAATSTCLGVERILAGIDHLAFVAALPLAVRGWSMPLKTVTAFTAAYSVTLALASLGYVSLSPPPVETLIALSILVLAVEAIHLRQGRPSLASRHPWAIAFASGLLHGFGSAGTLREIGLPQGDVPLALLCFKFGVELGQLAFVAAILATLAALRRLTPSPPPRLASPPTPSARWPRSGSSSG
ncbi:HupE/UreJ family protein [Albimonas sp. CAU 1670]|uniref:HupE/UreJ family protein n=1 Tax=Albimonas sp. CAU 1670 TaxID=3032599 RepID=UPI0023D9D614|nr:HupE/UreJ family protein [Albimonas sp. CAU 1670]MDF2233806.1 HupE/UreJ family protein [Albimonas sp. CAU 1670]